MFWVHRLQHLILHHVAPFLVMLAVPGETLALGLPAPLRERLLRPLLWSAPVRLGYRCVQQPLVASLLFVGLIYFWLIPSVHFDAMLSATRYRIMNWSMVLDGLLFWWLVVSPHRPGAGGLGYGVRIGMLWGVMLPQLALGAYIALHGTVLYDVYAVCGRAWPLSPLVDQEVGGLLTWIPPGMMSAIGMLVVLRMWIHDDARRHPSARSAGALAGQSR